MRSVFTALVVLLAMGSPAWAAAQMKAPASGEYGFKATLDNAERAVQSGIKSLDLDGKTLTLSDGMILTIPSSRSTEALKPGELVTVTYKTQGEKKVLAGFWIETGPLGM